MVPLKVHQRSLHTPEACGVPVPSNVADARSVVACRRKNLQEMFQALETWVLGVASPGDVTPRSSPTSPSPLLLFGGPTSPCVF